MSLPNKTYDIANATGILHRANDAWQQSIHEGIPGLVFVYSLVEKELRYINKEFVDTLGYSYEEVTNWKQDLSNLIFKEDLPFFEQQLDNICGLRPGVHLGFPYRLKVRGGDSIQFHVTGCILQDINKAEPTHILFFAHNISSQVKAKEELERKITELKRSNKDLEEFAYIASHDMHEPLRKVHSFADRLKTKYSVSVEEEAKGYLDRILAATQSARQMIDGLMEFSRLSRNGYGFEKVDLNGLVSEVLNDLELKIEETNTTVVVEKLPTIEVIRIQLKQLFNNVILNAIKFRKEGTSARIVIRSMRLAQNEIAGYNLNNNLIYWKLTIEDSGIGFEEEYAETIFQMFQRLNGKSEYPGSGIGLALCKKITDNHHGGIAAKGVVGEGTVITVVLPEKNIT